MDSRWTDRRPPPGPKHATEYSDDLPDFEEDKYIVNAPKPSNVLGQVGNSETISKDVTDGREQTLDKDFVALARRLISSESQRQNPGHPSRNPSSSEIQNTTDERSVPSSPLDNDINDVLKKPLYNRTFTPPLEIRSQGIKAAVPGFPPIRPTSPNADLSIENMFQHRRSPAINYPRAGYAMERSSRGRSRQLLQMTEDFSNNFDHNKGMFPAQQGKRGQHRVVDHRSVSGILSRTVHNSPDTDKEELWDNTEDEEFSNPYQGAEPVFYRYHQYHHPPRSPLLRTSGPEHPPGLEQRIYHDTLSPSSRGSKLRVSNGREFRRNRSSNANRLPITSTHRRFRPTYDEYDDPACATAGQIDWRAKICSMARTSTEIPDAALLEVLRDIENVWIPAQVVSCEGSRFYYQVIYRVKCGKSKGEKYLVDPPTYEQGIDGRRSPHLNGESILQHSDLHIEDQKHLSFVVFEDYTCCTKEVKEEVEYMTEEAPVPSGEAVRLVSQFLSDALVELAKMSGRGNRYPDLDMSDELQYPYPWMFHERHFIKVELQKLREIYAEHLRLLLHYMETRMTEEYEIIERQLSSKEVSSDFLEYLFVPGELLAVADPKGEAYTRVYKQQAWPEINRLDNNMVVKGKASGDSPTHTVNIFIKSVMCWEYDGNFEEKVTKLERKFSCSSVQPCTISELDVYPLKFAEPSVLDSLTARGEMFWACRTRRFVSYTGWDFNRNRFFEDTRLMIDMSTYKRMHPPEPSKNDTRLSDGLGPDKMEQDDPPPGDFLLLLPPMIYGFDMQDKTWMTLLVGQMKPVSWNKRAFDSLAVDERTKKLIKALVTTKISVDKSTDLIRGKGNGLILLLHGGPGTGKTLTAESVAEYAEKPLYRVTCGDVGTKPEDVEKYLNIVLYLGKIWGCVVLLDEAEVFLQQRNLEDMQRNALVSVFLRVLEYYEGILILTSNRVGTFDEAFKSRIHLALHYESLTKAQREKIWRNFINHLRSVDAEGIDYENLESNVQSLAEHNINGRQIRNAVNTARQLAKYDRGRVDFQCLEDVIAVSRQFDDYLKKVNDNISDEDIARSDGLR